MRLKMLLLIMLALSFVATVQAQLTPTPAPFPELEPITLENASRLVELPGTLTDVNQGYDVSPDGKQIAVARPDGVYLYDMGHFETPANVFAIDGALEIRDPHFSHRGNKLSITVLMPLPDKEISYATYVQLWDMETNSLDQTFEAFKWLVTDVVFSPDDRFIAGRRSAYEPGGCCWDSTAYLSLWSIDATYSELPCQEVEACYGRYGVTEIEFSPDSQFLFWSIHDFVPGSYDGQFWRIESLPSTGTLQPDRYDALMNNPYGPFDMQTSNIGFSADGKILYAHNDKTDFGSLWDVETGELKLSLLPGTRFGGFLPDNLIVVADDKQRVEYLLQIDTGRRATLFENPDEKVSIFPATDAGKLFVWWEDFETIHFYGVPAESKSTL